MERIYPSSFLLLVILHPVYPSSCLLFIPPPGYPFSSLFILLFILPPVYSSSRLFLLLGIPSLFFLLVIPPPVYPSGASSTPPAAQHLPCSEISANSIRIPPQAPVSHVGREIEINPARLG